MVDTHRISLRVAREDLVCPHCGTVHEDIDVWALKPHATHLCLKCDQLFEGSGKAVSNPRFTEDFTDRFLFFGEGEAAE